ncbi:MAG: tetratricopeptide repeat protein [Brumimicrobium sp.]|nr:tetratricopeptide repeat protein [Brumimicrobium sp.]
MIFKPQLLVLFLVVFSHAFLYGQTTKKYSSEYADFYRGEELFQKEQFSAAREVFSAFIENFGNENDPQYIKARYYQGISALNLYNNDAVQLLQEFNNDYPESIYKNTIYFKIGQYFYQSKKFGDAKEWFEKTDRRDIDTSLLAEYYFKLGYSNFQLGEYSSARNAFYEIKDGNSNYSAPALYYYSHIAYQNKTFQVALEGFLKLLEDPTFSKEVPYYITQIYYLLGDYEKVTEFAPSENPVDSDENSAEMNLLIGDAYYKIGKFDEAVPYLENFSKRKQTTREQDYALGYAYFKSKMYDQAIRQFDRVSRQEDELAQAALYHAAECYLLKNEENYARTAFKAAADMEYNATIQEDALYNYAVLSYKTDYNPYNEAIKAFEEFLRKFPLSPRKEDVYSYLVNVYSSTKKYEEALASIERIEKINIKLKTAYQIISYNMGVEAYERGNYSKAISAFQGVSKYDIDPNLTGQATFWEADAYYILGRYPEAVIKYRSFLGIPGVKDPELKQTAYYNIAYAYYQQKDWVQAIEAFRTFTQLSDIRDQAKLADAYARIGDCYYTKESPEFQKSAENYQKAADMNKGNQDRILFSLARVYKYLPDRQDDRIKTLLNIINNYSKSSYVIPAIFEVGISYKYQGDNQKAIKYLQQIVNDFPNNILVKDALIEIGDIKYKMKKYEESESYFRRVLSEYSLDSTDCKRATQGLVDIYRATRQQEKINQIGKQYACADISEDDEEVFYYETANDLYLEEKYDEAIPEIEKYLNRYPEGRFSIQLMSYLADIYYQRDEKDKALIYYNKIIERPKSGFTEEALVRASKMLYNQGKYEEALPYYERLEELASNPQVIYNTRIGLMRTNFLVENYENAVNAAEKVLGDKLLSDQSIKLEANYIAGMSLFKIGEFERALPYLKWTADNTGEVRGTEALHTLAEAHFNLGNYSKAEELHNALLKRKPAYDYWIAKSLILQARVHVAKNDLFQAEKTINLVINNYPNEEDGILTEARQVKAEIMQLKNSPQETQGDTNRSIEINEGNNE